MVRIIEILNDNNVWQALVLPNGPDGKNSLVVSHNDCSDWVLKTITDEPDGSKRTALPMPGVRKSSQRRSVE